MIDLHALLSLPLPESISPFLEERDIEPSAVRQYARIMASEGGDDREELRLAAAFVAGFTMGLQAAEARATP
jgi:hypothetical protein